MPAAAIEPAVNVLMGMLASASMGAGVPAGGWPRAQLRVEDAKMILDVQKVKMLASEQKAWCPSRRPEQRCFRGGGQAPEGSMNLWLGPLLVLIPVVFGFRFGQAKELLQAIRPRVFP